MKVYFFLAAFILLDIANVPFSASKCSCSDDTSLRRPQPPTPEQMTKEVETDSLSIGIAE